MASTAGNVRPNMAASLIDQSTSLVDKRKRPLGESTVMTVLSVGLDRNSGHISRVALPEPSEAAVWVTLYSWLDAAEPIWMYSPAASYEDCEAVQPSMIRRGPGLASSVHARCPAAVAKR